METRELIIKEIHHQGEINFELAEDLLERNAEFHFIKTINWSEFSYKPDVKFKIAYWQDQIWLKYFVSEESIMARVSGINGDVYKDSCVEFFFSPKPDGSYYNFEFNCIGKPHVSYGFGRKDRALNLIDPEILKLIQIRSTLGDQTFEEKTGGHYWEMMIIIPKDCLIKDENIDLKGLQARANFYKCGDETFKPHFVTWNPIRTETPDYHQPEFFGKLLFE